MKNLDLTNAERSDIKYKISSFPDGQQAITLDMENTGFFGITFEKGLQEVTIKSRLNSFKDLELIICANQALIELGIQNSGFKLKEINLYVPYFIGARSDRKFLNGQSNYLKTVICPIINSQNFSRVTILDPHSDVLEACLDNFQKISNVYFASNAIKRYVEGDLTLISPDAGALKKIYDVSKAIDCNRVIVANKLRDMVTGNIIRMEVPGLDDTPGSKSFVICDDIGDGFGTFIQIAKSIRNIRPKEIFNDRIYLVVTHSIQEIGLKNALEYIDLILTTNSVNDYNIDRVKIFNVF
jgi:ribose-phosphate pyrophosphokinase